jgi:hypothetical protein
MLLFCSQPSYVSCSRRLYFVISLNSLIQDDLRKMSKADRVGAQTKLDRGGPNVIEHYGELASFRMKLFKSADEFFAFPAPLKLDETDPTMLIVGRDE